MIRAVIRDRRGDIVRDPIHFEDEADFKRYCIFNRETFARTGNKIEELPPSPLGELLGTFELVKKLALQANGILKEFVIDKDMHRRWQNRTPTREDIKLLGNVLESAGELFVATALKEYGLDNQDPSA